MQRQLCLQRPRLRVSPFHSSVSHIQPRLNMIAATIDSQLTQLIAGPPPARIILGTQSSSRREIMQELSSQHGNFEFSTCAAYIDEQAIRTAEPAELVRLLAAAKADAILARTDLTDGYLITCDQVVVHEGRILEKPESLQQARDFIAGYARSPASTVGSVMVTNLATSRSYCEVDVSTIHFSAIPQSSVEQLLAEGDVLYCAGGLMVEHPLVIPHVMHMEGSQDAVMGLSKKLVIKLMLQAAGLCA